MKTQGEIESAIRACTTTFVQRLVMGSSYCLATGHLYAGGMELAGCFPGIHPQHKPERG